MSDEIKTMGEAFERAVIEAFGGDAEYEIGNQICTLIAPMIQEIIKENEVIIKKAIREALTNKIEVMARKFTKRMIDEYI